MIKDTIAQENHQNTDEENTGTYVLRLYVIGASPNSTRAVSNMKSFCEKYLRDNYSLEIIDVHQQPEIAEKEEIIALPLLIKKFPAPARRLIGDMSDTDKVLRGLGIYPQNL